MRFLLTFIVIFFIYSCDNSNNKVTSEYKRSANKTFSSAKENKLPDEYIDIGVIQKNSRGESYIKDSLDLTIFKEGGVVLKCSNSSSNYISILTNRSLIYLTEKRGGDYSRLFIINTQLNSYPYRNLLTIWEDEIFLTDDKEFYKAFFRDYAEYATKIPWLDLTYSISINTNTLRWRVDKTNYMSRYSQSNESGKCEIVEEDFFVKLKEMIVEIQSIADSKRQEEDKRRDSIAEKREI